MKLITLIILTSMSVSRSLCFDKFEIIETTSQKWTGGQKDTGYGTYYEITIVPKVNSEELLFDQAWLGKRFFEISSFQKGKKMRNNLFGKGDTITIRINDNIRPKSSSLDKFDKKVKALAEKNPPPFEYKGKILLSYKYKEKRKYKEIKEIIIKEPLFYP